MKHCLGTVKIKNVFFLRRTIEAYPYLLVANSFLMKLAFLKYFARKQTCIDYTGLLTNYISFLVRV